jgi:hypothetical protein
MANGNINTQQDPRNILGQLVAGNLSTFQSEEGEKVLRKFFKTSAEEIVSQPGGAQMIAANVQPKPEAGTQQSSQQLQQPQQEQQAEQQDKVGPLGMLKGLLQTFASGAGQDSRANEANIRLAQAQSAELEARPELALKKLKAEETKLGTLTANNIFTKFEPVVNNFQGIIDSFSRVEASISDPSAAGDLALIFNFMKILDPNSVVRESEFATAQNSASVPERIRALYNNVLEGERLSPKTRNDVSGRAKKLFESKERQFDKQRSDFQKIAVRNRIDPEDVLRDPRLIQEVQNMSDEELQRIAGGN